MDLTYLLKELYVGRWCNIRFGRAFVSITIKIIDTYSGSNWNIPIIIWGYRTNQVNNTNKYETNTKIYWSKDTCGTCVSCFWMWTVWFTRWVDWERCGTMHRSLVRALISLSNNLLHWNTLLECLLYTSFNTTFGKDCTCVVAVFC